MSPKLKLLLKIVVPTAFIALCVSINAIAFTEIQQSIRARRTSTHRANTHHTSTKTGDNVQLPEAISARGIAPEPVTIQNTASIEPQGNQLVSVPVQTARLETHIRLRPINAAGLTNDPQPIQITPVLRESAAKPVLKESAAEPATNSVAATNSVSDAAANPTLTTTTTQSSREAVNPDSANQDSANQDIDEAAKYGHLPYTEGNADEMTLIASYTEAPGSHRVETLHPEAAKALSEMVAAARVDKIWLVPASGFRTIAQQRTLFNAQIERKGSPEAAAKVSAPPGYSEHHTGYAVDLTDGTLPQSYDISEQFAQSPAYEWLLENAKNHGFELSFPEGNEQGVNFEPWHWRYVGSVQSREQLGLQTPFADTRNTTNTFTE